MNCRAGPPSFEHDLTPSLTERAIRPAMGEADASFHLRCVWHAVRCARAIARHRDQVGSDADRISAVWRTKQLEYTWTLTLAGHYRDFWWITERALDYSLALVPGIDKSVRSKLLDAYFTLDAFPDARSTLRALKSKGRETGILSNGSPAMLKGAVEAAGIGSDLDAVLSVDTLKMFKPRPEVYRLVTNHFDCKPGDDIRIVQSVGRHGRCLGWLQGVVGQSYEYAR
jgi:2-haloalkanoic acid dehalogenase type II